MARARDAWTRPRLRSPREDVGFERDGWPPEDGMNDEPRGKHRLLQANTFPESLSCIDIPVPPVLMLFGNV